jgi:hypothetical protein
MKYYTGVGSRKTPLAILDLMTRIAEKMNKRGYRLRSGGAMGADTAFEIGAGEMKDIYFAHHANEEAKAIAEKFHPAWEKCSEYAKKLHGRNAFQILGQGLNTPSEYCICWTPDGCIKHADRTRTTGGTGTAISIADAYGVPVINLARAVHLGTYSTWVDTEGL